MRYALYILVVILFLTSMAAIIGGIIGILYKEEYLVPWIGIIAGGIIGVILSYIFNRIRRRHRPVPGIDYL